MKNEKTILVCDDDEAILDSVSQCLSSAGYRVVTARQHDEVEEHLHGASPDLLILDVRMPGRDGFWIAEHLQVLGNTAPVIFMTAYDRAIYRMYAPFVGSVEYLTKPVDVGLLLDTVRKTLSN